MSDFQEYTLRWRGKQLGPFSLEEINHKLDDHEIGLTHEIQHQDAWISLEEFFAALKSEAAAKTPSASAAAGNALPSSQIGNPTPGRPVLRITGAPRPTGAKGQGPQRGSANLTTAPRRRLLYALLGVLLGFSGVHNYYARHWLTGLLQLFLSIATYLLGFGIIAPWLWALVEAVVVRKDGNGIEMI